MVYDTVDTSTYELNIWYGTIQIIYLNHDLI